MKQDEFKKGEIVIYQSKDGPKLDVRLVEETIWLTKEQIALLFGTQRPAITKHLKNIFDSGELDEKVVSCILEHTTKHGALKGKTQTKKVKFYNLDAIISVGYRVNSKRATQFRIWATKTLKEHLVKGYTINEKRLLQAKNQLQELQGAISFLQEKSKHELLAGQEQEIFNLLANYSRTLTLLEQYDNEKLSLIKNTKGRFILKYEEAINVISKIKKDLVAKKEASDLFNSSSKTRYQEYVFMKDEKMLECMEIDYENNKVKVDLDKLYPNIDIAETLSNLTGKWIKKISDDEVEFEDGTEIKTKDLDYELIKPLIWWE